MRKILLTIMLCALPVTSISASAENPIDAKIYVSRGMAYEQRGQPANAINAYREAIRINSKYYSAYQALGIVLAKNGRQSEAIIEFEKAKTLDPNNWVVLSDSDIENDPFLTKPYDSAIEVCRQEISANSAEMRTRVYLTQNYMLAERRLEK